MYVCEVEGWTVVYVLLLDDGVSTSRECSSVVGKASMVQWLGFHPSTTMAGGGSCSIHGGCNEIPLLRANLIFCTGKLSVALGKISRPEF